MAKTKMMCPFSDKLCKECALYRGRHYYLCFCEKYRGYMDETRQGSKAKPSFALGTGAVNRKFEIPLVKPKNAVDPFTIIMKELGEEN